MRTLSHRHRATGIAQCVVGSGRPASTSVRESNSRVPVGDWSADFWWFIRAVEDDCLASVTGPSAALPALKANQLRVIVKASLAKRPVFAVAVDGPIVRPVPMNPLSQRQLVFKILYARPEGEIFFLERHRPFPKLKNLFLGLNGGPSLYQVDDILVAW